MPNCAANIQILVNNLSILDHKYLDSNDRIHG